MLSYRSRQPNVCSLLSRRELDLFPETNRPPPAGSQPCCCESSRHFTWRLSSCAPCRTANANCRCCLMFTTKPEWIRIIRQCTLYHAHREIMYQPGVSSCNQSLMYKTLLSNVSTDELSSADNPTAFSLTGATNDAYLKLYFSPATGYPASE